MEYMQMNEINECNIGKCLKNIMAAKKYTISMLSDATSISEDTIKSIRSGKTQNPGIYTILNICNALGCSIDEFLGNPSISDDEAELLKGYNHLYPHGKRYIQTIIQSELIQQPADEHSSKRYIPVVSPIQISGSDVDFSMHNTDVIEIPWDYYPTADFAVRICTRKLHPIYGPGDILAIETGFPSIGNVAMFVDKSGTQLIRRYEESNSTGYLTSINGHHLSTRLSDDIICIGTILGIIRYKEITAHKSISDTAHTEGLS